MKLLLLFLAVLLSLAAPLVCGKKTSAEWNKFVREGSEVEKEELREVRDQPDIKNFEPMIIGMDFIPGYSERDRELAGRRITTALLQASLHVTMQRTGPSTPDRWVILTKNRDEARKVFAFFEEFITSMDDIMRVRCDDMYMDVWNLPRFQKEMEAEKLKPKPKRKYGMPDESERRFQKLSVEEKMRIIEQQQQQQQEEVEEREL